jgi:hypothetical protein
MALLHDVAHDLHLSNPSISVEQFKQAIEHCKVWQYEWGVIMALENDMHIHVLSSHRKMVFLRPAISKAINETFESYDLLTTSVSKDKPFKTLINYLVMGWKLVANLEDKWMLEMKKEDFTYGKN